VLRLNQGTPYPTLLQLSDVLEPNVGSYQPVLMATKRRRLLELLRRGAKTRTNAGIGGRIHNHHPKGPVIVGIREEAR
jgi:hypothetical protein